MSPADVVILLLVVLFGGTSLVLQVAWHRPDSAGSTFDEHAATALAPVAPDDPTLPDLPRLSFVEQVEAYVAQHAPKES